MYVIQHNIGVDMVVLLIQFMRLLSYNALHFSDFPWQPL